MHDSGNRRTRICLLVGRSTPVPSICAWPRLRRHLRNDAAGSNLRTWIGYALNWRTTASTRQRSISHSTALLLVGLVGGLAGILFAVIAPLVSLDFLPLRASIGSILIFAAGVSFTSITIVLDQALIGLLRGELQFWRNTLFAASKLAALITTGLALHSSLFRGGVAIYATWALGNAISLVPLAILVLVKNAPRLNIYA